MDELFSQSEKEHIERVMGEAKKGNYRYAATELYFNGDLY